MQVLLAYDFLQVALPLLLFGKAEVPYLQFVIVFDKYIGRLDISVNKAFWMNVFDSAEELLEQLQVLGSVDLSSPSIQELSQGLSFAVLHLDHQVQGDEILLVFNESFHLVIRVSRLFWIRGR